MLNRQLTWKQTFLPVLRKGTGLFNLTGLAAAFLLVTRLISDVSFSLADSVLPVFGPIDPDGAFLYITLHHVFQAGMSVGCIAVMVKVLRVSYSDFGFNHRQWRYAIKRVIQFCVAWFIVQGSIVLVLMLSGTEPAPFNFPLTIKNFTAYFLFQVLLSGTSEEILYRSLVIIPLMAFCRKAGFGEKWASILSVFIATLCFMVGHINFAFDPFRITYFNLAQQITVVIFGLFYAYLFVKTRSLIGPILAHNWLNGVIVIISLLSMVVFG